MAAKSEILWISLPAPVLNVANTKGNVYRTSNQKLWSKENAESWKDDSFFDVDGSYRPASISFWNDEPVKLRVRYRVSPELASKKLHLEGRLKGRDKVSWTKDALSVDPTSREGEQDVLLRPRWLRKGFPWGVVGDINWHLTEDDPRRKSVAALDSTRIEIYGLTDKLPKFFFDRVDVDLLRAFVLPAGKASTQDWTRYVVKAAFWDFGFRYDSYNGGSTRYIGRYGGDFPLKQWLWDIGKGIRINCFDQGAIVQVALSLGPLKASDIVWHHMRPFGLLQTTELVGRGLANNPIPASGSNPSDTVLVADNYEKRRAFGSHVFIVAGGKVADACAGPHVGTETIQEYVDHAIVPETAAATVYSLQTNDENGNKQHPGKKQDALPHKGVEALNRVASETLEEMNKQIEARTTSADGKILNALFASGQTDRKETDSEMNNVNLTAICDFFRSIAVQYDEPLVTVGELGARATWYLTIAEEGAHDLHDIDIDLFCMTDQKAAKTFFNYRLGHYHGSPEKFYSRPSTDKGQLNLAGGSQYSSEEVWVSSCKFVRVHGLLPLKKLQALVTDRLQAELLATPSIKPFEAKHKPLGSVLPGEVFGLKYEASDDLYWHIEDAADKKTEPVILMAKEEDKMTFWLQAPPETGVRTLKVSFADAQNFGAKTDKITVNVEKSAAKICTEEGYQRAQDWERAFLDSEQWRSMFPGHIFEPGLPVPNLAGPSHVNDRFNHAILYHSNFGKVPKRLESVTLKFANGAFISNLSAKFQDGGTFSHGRRENHYGEDTLKLHDSPSARVTMIELGLDDKRLPLTMSVYRSGENPQTYAPSANNRRVTCRDVFRPPTQNHGVVGFWGVAGPGAVEKIGVIWAE